MFLILPHDAFVLFNLSSISPFRLSLVINFAPVSHLWIRIRFLYGSSKFCINSLVSPMSFQPIVTTFAKFILKFPLVALSSYILNFADMSFFALNSIDASSASSMRPGVVFVSEVDAPSLTFPVVCYLRY